MENTSNILADKRIVLVDDQQKAIDAFLPALQKVTNSRAVGVLYRNHDIVAIRDMILAQNPDIVLMDFQLGPGHGINGDAVVYDMLRHTKLFRHPITFVGFSSQMERRKDFMTAGAHAFVQKNVLDVQGSIRQLAHEIELLSIK